MDSDGFDPDRSGPDGPGPDGRGPDESIRPDDVIPPDSATTGSAGDGAFGPDELAARAVDMVLGLLRRATALVRGVLIFAVVACVGGYTLGIVVLGGGLRTVWIIAGGAAAIWAIGSVSAAMFRLHVVRNGADVMVEEFRSLIGGDNRSQRTVIETVEATQASDDEGIVSLSRQFFSLRDVVDHRRSDFTQLSLALASITTLPAAMALATVIGFGFVGLSVIFALVLIF